MMFPAIHWLKTGASTFVDLLYPVACAHCERPVESGRTLCANCLEDASEIVAPYCETCSQPFYGEIDGPFFCADCMDRKFAFDCAVSAYRSRGMVRELIHRFKYEGHFHLRRPLSVLLRRAMDDGRIRSRAVDALVPVPLHPRRQRERGYNQAEALCRLLGREAALPVWLALRRVRFTETQTHFSREERLNNLRGAFAARPRWPLAGKHLLLVDDVFTTGSTVHECARVLRRAGAASVRVLTVARG